MLTDDTWQTADVFKRCLSVADFDDVSQLAGDTSEWCTNNRRLSRSCCQLVNDGVQNVLYPVQDDNLKSRHLERGQFLGSTSLVAASCAGHMTTVSEVISDDCLMYQCHDDSQRLAMPAGCKVNVGMTKCSSCQTVADMCTAGNRHSHCNMRRLSRSAHQLPNTSNCSIIYSCYCQQHSSPVSRQHLHRPCCHGERFRDGHRRMSKSCCHLADVAHSGKLTYCLM
jgi:hypothetical protein